MSFIFFILLTCTVGATHITFISNIVKNGIHENMALEVGDQINCTARGRPEPSYEWRNMNTLEVINGHILKVTDKMVMYLMYLTEYQYICEELTVHYH